MSEQLTSDVEGSDCARCSSPLERGDLRCAVCGMPTPVHTQAARGDTTIANILRCHGCGAAVSYDATIQAPRCDFCGSVMEVETPDDPLEEAERYLCFRVDERTARATLMQWLGGRGFFRPSDLRQASKVDSLRPLWWVGWSFHARVLVCWAADSTAGARRSRWAPHSGQLELDLTNVVVSASRGLSQAECAELVPRYALSDADVQPVGPAPATIERFDVQRSAARRIVASALGAQAAHHAAGHIPGSSYRKLNVTVLPRRLTTRRHAFPAYVLAYRYRNRLYRAIVHGQDPTCVVGEAPYSIARIALVAAAVLAVIAFIAAIATAAG